MDAQGGYFVRLESFDGLNLVALTRQALVAEGLAPESVSLRVSAHRKRRVVHLTLESAGLKGPAGALWFSAHPALAQLLSCRVPGAVQSYAIDPDRFEEVFTWAQGRRVGGERLEYATVELPADAEADDLVFERVRSHWPLGHLAHVFGLPRSELLAVARSRGLLLSLDDERVEEQLASLLPPPMDALPAERSTG